MYSLDFIETVYILQVHQQLILTVFAVIGVSCDDTDVFVCANLTCIPSLWRCDQDDDCGDNSDERNCRKYSFLLVLNDRTRALKRLSIRHGSIMVGQSPSLTRQGCSTNVLFITCAVSDRTVLHLQKCDQISPYRQSWTLQSTAYRSLKKREIRTGFLSNFEQARSQNYNGASLVSPK